MNNALRQKPFSIGFCTASAAMALCLAKIPYLGELAPGGLQIILAVAMAS
jgi:hypothetical protein